MIRDGLEIRWHAEAERFRVFDVLTGRWGKGGDYRTRDVAERRLESARVHRPLIVRWIYGFSIGESKQLGVSDFEKVVAK